ncbi:hypothetical protein [Nocardioides sp. Leaf285]|uniref:restriction system modified-DNA reader domain-containing protein n=1 Tax=Nocardioides sp. Leaf285 TaxID=1736322 RepID=UPI000703B09E|nr:hypothetical protein [Nocardioides sp. Leaf285]KQP63178.1 hypothetical protein ASF47_19400 [Nocardioides sp. Leaf285]
MTPPSTTTVPDPASEPEPAALPAARLTPKEALARVLPGPLALDPLRDHAHIERGRLLRQRWLEATEALRAFYDETGHPLAEDRPSAAAPDVPATTAGEEPHATTALTAGAQATVVDLAGSVTDPFAYFLPGPRGAVRSPRGSGNAVQVTVADLVLNGFLRPGDILKPVDAEDLSATWLAVVEADALLLGGQRYTKFSPAAAAVTGKATSGWGFWQVAATGETLDSVRERYRARFPSLRPETKPSRPASTTTKGAASRSTEPIAE